MTGPGLAVWPVLNLMFLKRGKLMPQKTLQENIEGFVETHGPAAGSVAWRRERFINDLRVLLNEYAGAALAHGNLPEVGAPHGGGVRAARPFRRPAVEPRTMSLEFMAAACREGCKDPRCTLPPASHDAMYIEQVCHPAAASRVYFDIVFNHAVVECLACGKEVARWKVANQ